MRPVTTHLRLRLMLLLAGLMISISVATPTLAQRTPDAPEAATGLEPKELAVASRHMVAAANPLAVNAGLEMLRLGGSAVDAAIATQLVLNLVEPQSSGIGGGAFLVHYDKARRRVTTIDGREAAPSSAKPDRFMSPDGKPVAFGSAVFSGGSVGVPGVMRLLEQAHKAHGKLAWARLFEPAIRIADDGFQISRRLHGLLGELGSTNVSPELRAHYFDTDGAPKAVGFRLTSPAMAATLRLLARDGANAFYSGEIAAAIVAAVAAAPKPAGDLQASDIAAYKAIERPAVCTTYRLHRICGMGPPSSGGIAIGQILAMLEPFNLGKQAMTAPALHLIAEAEKLAYADRDRYVADPDQVDVPAGLRDADYLKARSRLIDANRAAPKATAGNPPGLKLRRAGLDATIESNGTSHISIVDGNGNAVALTTTIENAFGSRLMAAGFLLNNQLTDFSFRPVDAEGQPIANAVGGNKRPRSSMAPTLVFSPDGRLLAVLGSPGGSRIILYVAKAIVGLVDWRLDPQAVADLANFGSRNGPFEIEAQWLSPLVALQLQRLGHQVSSVELNSGLHIIARGADGRWRGGADPRREGVARGD